MVRNKMNGELRPAVEMILELKNIAYAYCKVELTYIIESGFRDVGRFEALFDEITSFHGDDTFMELFWTMISYVEKFDREISEPYRRLEELLHEGL